VAARVSLLEIIEVAIFSRTGLYTTAYKQRYCNEILIHLPVAVEKAFHLHAQNRNITEYKGGFKK